MIFLPRIALLSVAGLAGLLAPAVLVSADTSSDQARLGRQSLAINRGLASATAGTVGAAASASTETASSADALVDSVGVNVHLNFNGTPYFTGYPNVKKALLALGVRHLRDSLSGTNYKGYYDEHNELGALGIKSIFTISVDEKADLFREYPSRMNRCFEGYENANEWDNKKNNPDWASELKASMILLSNTVRPGKYPVIGPSLVHSESFSALGDIHQYFDYANLHNYPGGHNPGTPGWGSPNAQGHVYGSMPWQLDLIKTNSPGLPFFSTETGYTNDLSLKGRAVPESVSAVYMPRLILNQWSSGATRTYIYELVSSMGEDFGLIHPDFTPKPAFYALSNLLKLLSDPGPAYQPGSLSYGIRGGDSALRHVLFQKRDGSYYLALWVEKSSFDVTHQQPTPVSPESVELQLPAGNKVTQYQWDNAGNVTPTQLVSGSTLPLSVSDNLMILKISK